jgi:hypothetical protein
LAAECRGELFQLFHQIKPFQVEERRPHLQEFEARCLNPRTRGLSSNERM